MTIDHGLGGRDGVKSKQRREKKARKQKIVATKAITGGKKKEVIFDEKARVEWLSGFHKRKQERRKYGLAMEVLKKHKAHKEMLKEQRTAFDQNKEEKHDNGAGMEDDDIDEGGDDEETLAAAAAAKFTASVTSGKNQEVSVFEDPSTVSMFGSTVSVVVDTSIGEANSDDEQEDYNSSQRKPAAKKAAKNAKPELTRLEKALKIAKTQMGKRKKHKDNSIQGKASSSALKKKVESSKLLSKVLQKPMKGKHSGGRRRK